MEKENMYLTNSFMFGEVQSSYWKYICHRLLHNKMLAMSRFVNCL